MFTLLPGSLQDFPATSGQKSWQLEKIWHIIKISEIATIIQKG
jgi:hypothetical protein